MTEQATVLWVDEEQAEWFGLMWTLQDLGLRILSALSVTEAIDMLKHHDPKLIILDLIVRGQKTSVDRFTGLDVWDALTTEQRDRTIILSIVPSVRSTASVQVDRSRVFSKDELETVDGKARFLECVASILGEAPKSRPPQ